VNRDELRAWLRDNPKEFPHRRDVAVAMIEYHDEQALWGGAPPLLFSLASAAYQEMLHETVRLAAEAEARELERVRSSVRALRSAIGECGRLVGGGTLGTITGADGCAFLELGWQREQTCRPLMGYRISVEEVLDAAEKMIDLAQARPVQPLVQRQRARPRERAFVRACSILARSWAVDLRPARLAALTNAVLRLPADHVVDAAWVRRVIGPASST